MGYIHATIALSNPRRPELAPLPVSARADSGALMLCIPAPLAAALQLQQESLRAVSVADGRVLQVPYATTPTKKRARWTRLPCEVRQGRAQAEPTPT